MHLTPWVALLAPALAVAAEGGPARPATEWSGVVGAGVIVLTGNAETTTMNGAASAQREAGGWILAGKATGVYGRTRPADRSQPAQTVALGATGQLRADRKLGAQLTVFALGGAETDHVASLEYRAYGEGGAGWLWLDRKPEAGGELFLRTDLGLRYTYDERWQYYGNATAPEGDLPDVEMLAPRAGLAFRYGFSEQVKLVEEAEVLTNVSGDERWQARSLTKLTSRLIRAVSFGLSYQVTYDSAPAPGKVRTDTALGANVEVAF